ncbi:lysophospholipid acyltransferase family protein [Hymenobacter lapidiphilus]|uniref:lysophospholipid acyltransferase family protein n=1 Tax=Hymenobacter sp. CCM 8763 TaxID=2303334 RepID=UPI00167E77EB|nr:lysophospholipid acyltransferase family protein [Hymenobacter sp. CCM 8763]
MMHTLRYIGQRLYTTWATFWFMVPFVVTYPVQWGLSHWPAGWPYLRALNKAWSRFFILMWGVPVETVRATETVPPGQPCLYLANHSSLIDIPLLFCTLPGGPNVLGKSSLAKIPLWGPIFGRAYITVDRNSAVSRGRAIVRARQELAAGRSVIIFPEGQISSQPGRQLEPFKEGAFQLAIAAGVPIVPITMPLNHRFLPDVGGLRVRWARLAIVVHAPISTAGLTAADAPALQQHVFEVITSGLRPEAGGIPGPGSWRPQAARTKAAPAAAAAAQPEPVG